MSRFVLSTYFQDCDSSCLGFWITWTTAEQYRHYHRLLPNCTISWFTNGIMKSILPIHCFSSIVCPSPRCAYLTGTIPEFSTMPNLTVWYVLSGSCTHWHSLQQPLTTKGTRTCRTFRGLSQILCLRSRICTIPLFSAVTHILILLPGGFFVLLALIDAIHSHHQFHPSMKD